MTLSGTWYYTDLCVSCSLLYRTYSKDGDDAWDSTGSIRAAVESE